MASSSIHISISNTNLSKITRPDLSAIRMTATSTKVILPSQSISRSSNLRLPSSSSPLRCTSILDHVRMAPEPPNKPREDPLRIAIIGFGNFGQFIARGLARQGHNVLATSRTDYSQYCNRHGIQFFRSLDAMCEEQPDIVLVCTSILSTEGVIRRIPLHKLKPDTIFADVLSVKQYPRNLFVEVLPPEFGIVCTHPMFGPESGRHGWVGLPFVYDQVRVRPHSVQARKCARFLNIFEKEGCRMVHMSCEEHDRYAAGSQFITHTIGRILSHLNLESTPINTKGYETLLNLTQNTVSDSTDLYFGLFMYNVNATEQIANLDRAFETVKQKLFGKLHDILREQIVERIPMPGTPTRVMDPHFLRDANRMEGLTSLIVPRRSEHVKRMEDISQQPSPLRSPSLR